MDTSSHVASLRSKLEETLVSYHNLNATEWNVAKKSAKGRDRMEETFGGIRRLSVSVKVKGLEGHLPAESDSLQTGVLYSAGCSDPPGLEICKVNKHTAEIHRQRHNTDEYGEHRFFWFCRYKAEGSVAELPERIVDYIRPGPYRLNWDSLMTSMDIVETLDKGSCVVKYTTAGQMWNIISPREFVDFSHTTDYENGLLSCGVSVQHDEHKQGFVRGFNHPCGWFCVPMENSTHSLLTGYIQTDLRGMLPQTAVDTAMASSLVNFYSDLRQALKV